MGTLEEKGNSLRVYPAHGVHSTGSHFDGQWAAAPVAPAVLALAPNCTLPGLTLSFYT